MRLQFFLNGEQTDIHYPMRVFDGEGLSEVTVPYGSEPDNGDTVEIRVDGDTILEGTIRDTEEHRKEGTKLLNIEGKNSILHEKICLDDDHYEYLNQDAGAIVKDLVDHYFSGTLTSNNVDASTGVTVNHFDAYGKNVLEGIKALNDRADTVVYVDYDDDIHYFVAGTESSGLTITAKDIFDLVKRRVGRGVGKVIVHGREGKTGEYGISTPEHYVKDRRISSDAEALALATALYDRYDVPRTNIRLITYGFWNARAKQTIILDSAIDGYENETFTVQSVTWRFGSKTVKTIFELGDFSYGTNAVSNLLDNIIVDIREKIDDYLVPAIYIVNDADQCDDTHPLYIRFYIPSETDKIKKATVSFKRESFRCYSKSAASTGGHTHSVTGATSSEESSHKHQLGSTLIGEIPTPDGHFEMVNIEGNYIVKIPTEATGGEGGSIPYTRGAATSHDHTVSGQTAQSGGSHSHSLTFGIYEQASPYGTIDLDVNGNDIAQYNADTDDIDITQHLSTGWNYIELTPDTLARITVAVYLMLYIKTL